MKKHLLLVFALALLVPWATRAQQTLTFPYTCGFETADDASDWVLVNGDLTNRWVIDTAVNNTTGGAKALYISNDTGRTAAYTVNSATVVYAYREVYLEPGEYTISYDWQCYGEGNYDFIIAAVVPSTVTLTAATALPTGITYSSMTAEGWQNIGPSGIKLNLSSTWSTQNSSFTITRAGTYRIVFLWRNDISSGTMPSGCVDNVVLDKQPCSRPADILVKDITFESATICWTDINPNGSTVNLYYSTDPNFSIDTLTPVTVADTAVTLSNLQPLTTYYFLLKSDCGSNVLSAATNKYSFSTLRNCGVGNGSLIGTIGTGTSTSYYQTAYNYNSASYTYGHSASIYTKEEMVAMGLEFPGLIHGIKLRAGATACVTPMRIYIGKTALSEFSAAGDTAGLSAMTLVFDDTIRTTAQEWVDIPFNTPFAYNPDSNLVIYYYRPGRPSASGNFYYTSTSSSYRSFYGYKSSAPTATSKLNFTRTYYRNNIIFDICYEIPNCIRPTDVRHTATARSLSLTWTGCDAATEYLVTYSAVGSDRVTTISAPAASTVIENLTPGTTYDITVRSVCGEDTTYAESHTATTECVVLTEGDLPWRMDFENASTGTISTPTFVNCLTRHNSTSSLYPIVGSTASYCHSGVRGLYWFCPTTAGAYQVVALPEVDTTEYPMNTLQLRFWAKATSNSYNPTLQVGVMTHPDSLNSFQLVQTINVGSSAIYKEYTALLDTFAGHGNVLAIRGVGGTSWYANLDDIVIEEIPNCPPIANLSATPSVGAAMLTWSYAPGYGDPEGYVVSYDTIGGDNPVELDVTDPMVVLTGLDAGTTYKAYVYADCGGDGIGTVDSVVFSTGNFACVEIDNTVADTTLFSNSTTGQSGCIGYTSYGNTAYQALWTAAELRAAGLTAGYITGIDLGFTANTSQAKEFTIFIGNTSSTSIASTTFEVPTADMQVYGPAAHPLNTSGWKHYNFTTPFNWDGESNIMITTFMNQPAGVSQSSSTGLTGYYVSAPNTARYRYKDSNPFTLGDVATSGTGATTYSYRAAIHFYTAGCSQTASCAAPQVEVMDVTTSSVTLAWAPGATETAWDIDYRISGAAEWTSAATEVTDYSYILDELTPGKEYEFRVSFECSADDTVYATVVTASTPCLPVSLPYSENFDSYTGTSTTNYGLLPNCWDYTMTNSSYSTGSYLPRVYYSTTYFPSGTHGLYLYGATIVTLPEMPTSLDSLQLILSDYVTSATSLYVGVIENDEWVPVDTARLTASTHNFVEINLDRYHGNSRTIALRNATTTTSSHYIDNIEVDYIPTCPHVVNLAVDTATENSITLKWNAVGEETAWSVVCGDRYFVADDSTFTVDNLEVNTPYTFEVRALCSADDSSRAMTLSTRTPCAEFMSLPFYENFDSYTTSTTAATGVQVPCWKYNMTNSSYATASYQPQLYYGTTYAHSGDYSLRLYGVGYTALPKLPVDVNQVSMSFWSGTSSTSYAMMVGVMTDPDSVNSFDTIETITYTTTATPVYHEINFSNYTGTGRYIVFRNYYSTYGYSYNYIDNVEVWQNSSCPSPVVNIADVDYNSVTVTWFDTTGVGYNGGNIYWSTREDFTTAQAATVTSGNSYTITGLAPATHYYVWVAGNCPVEPSRASRTEVTTIAACAPVENLTLSGVDNSSFGVSWNAPAVGAAATRYVVYLRQCTNTPYDTTEHWTMDTTANTHYLFSNLQSATTYAYAVRTLCDTNEAVYDGGYVTTTICQMDTVGDYSTNYAAQPIYATQTYAYTQQIYLDSELEGIDSINSLSLYQSGYDYNDRNITVYLGYTSKSEFASGTDYVPMSHLTQVYSGNLAGFGWVTLKLDNTYVRHADSNLVVAIDDNTGVAQSANCYWACTNFSSIYRALRIYGGTDVNPTSPSGSSARDYYRAYVVFGNAACEASTCPEPIVMQTASTTDRVDIAWNAVTGTTYTVEYRAMGATTWTTVNAANTTGADSITGLGAAFMGEVKVSYTCNGETVSGVTTISTLCGVASLPLRENFESHPTGNYSRACWISGSTYFDETDPLPRVTRLTGSDDKICNFQNGAYLILPQVNLPLDTLQIRFKLTQGDDDARLVLGLMADADMPIYSMLPLDTLCRHDYDTVLHTVDITYQFGTLPAGYSNARIAFWDAFGSYSFINDIVVEILPNCTPASDITAVATTDSAVISWATPGDNATRYVVEYGPRYFTLGTGLRDTVTGSSATLTNLAHSTSYDAYVYSICDSDFAVSIASQVVQFTTECAAFDVLPYTQDFENILAPGTSSNTALPNCWGAEANGTQPHVIYSSTPAQYGSPDHCFTFSRLGVAALPEMTAPLNTLKVSFRDYNTSANYGLIVGTVDNIDSGFAATFVPYDTIEFTGGTGNVYNVVSYLSDYTGTANRIAFRNYSKTGSTTSTHYIDDVVVDVLPTCVPPQHIKIDYLVGDEAHLSWNRSVASSYTVLYNIHDSATVNTLNTATRSIQLTGLVPETQYDVRIVGEGCTDTVSYSFTTLCAAVTLPYVEDFESLTTGTATSNLTVMPDCWNYELTGSSTYQGASYYPGVYYSSTYANNGDYSLRLYGVGNFALPPMPTDLDSLQMTFFPYKATASYLLEVGTMEGTTFVPFDTVNFAVSAHPEYTVRFSNYTGNSRIIAFRNSNGTTGYSSIYLDDITVEYIPSCPKVDSLKVIGMSNNSIVLSWEPVGDETEWRVTFNGGDTIVNTNTPTITGLSANEEYLFVVRPICAVGDTGLTRSVIAHTTCNPVSLPYVENFDSIRTGTANGADYYGLVPNCWDYIMTGSSTYQAESYQPRVYYTTSYAHSGNYCLYLNGVGYTMLPPMPTDLDSLEFTFWARVTSTSYGLEVGVMEGTTFVPVANIAPTTTNTQYLVDFANYTGNSRIIAFRNFYTSSSTTYYSYVYIDDIDVHYLPSCPRVLDVRSTAASVSTITVDWTDQTTASEWQIEYGPEGHAIGAANAHSVIVTQHPYTISGFDTLTNYDFYVRPICTVGDTGRWSNKATLGTEMCNGAIFVSTGAATGTGYAAPVNNLWKYTLSESIIDSAELAGIGDISSIAYSYAYGTAMTKKTNVTIWLQPTTKSTFSSTSDMVPLNAATAVRVYHGNLNCVQGWNYFALDTTYVWDGHSNLLIIVDDNSFQYDGSAYIFNTSSCTGSKTLVYASDSEHPNPSSPSSFGGTSKNLYSYRPTMKLGSCGVGPCELPSIDSVATTETTVTVTFSGPASNYELALVEEWNDSIADAVTPVTASATYTFEGLTEGTTYTLAIRSVCTATNRSEWLTQEVTTDVHPCLVPTNVTVSGITYSSATVDWTPGEADHSRWAVRVTGEGGYDHTDTVTAHPYTVNGLTDGTQYYVQVMTLCAHGESDFTTAVPFTTTGCPTVTGLAAGTVTATTAVLNWNAVAGSTGRYEVNYGMAGFPQGSGQITTVNGSTTVTLEGLESETMYDAYVRVYCAEGVASNWSTKVTFETSRVGINDVDGNAISLYPNPASTTVTLTGIEGAATVTVVDMNGRETGKWNVENGKLTIDVSDLAQGAYFVRITGEQVNAIRKLIVR